MEGMRIVQATFVKRGAPVLLAGTVLAGILLVLTGCVSQPTFDEDEQTYKDRIMETRADRDNHYKTTLFNAFGLMRRHYFEVDETLTIGSGPQAGLRIDDPAFAAIHAIVEGPAQNPTLTAKAKIVEVENPENEITDLAMKNKSSFRIGRFHLRYNVSQTGRRNVEVFDPEHPNAAGFESLDYFPVDPSYRVWGTIVPSDDPKPITITDSQDGAMDYFLYGELRFELEGEALTLELYTKTLDPEKIKKARHLLLFRDLTSGKETYPAARYLWVEGKMSGAVEVDFNMAFNPSCNYSYLYECPLPRPKNSLKVAIRAGEKYYKKHAVEILQPAL